jgi:glycosyltransferase involved in cell wall biosynthesis
VSGLDVLVPADVRFPLARASGIQIVKTAAALARAGARTTLLVRDSDPRPTDEVLALYGLRPHAGLQVRRFRVRHRRSARMLPRAVFLARAAAAALVAMRRGAVVFTRDLQLAAMLVRLRPLARGSVVYEAHAVEALMYRERGRLYGTGEVAGPRKALRLEGRERTVWRRAQGFVATTAGIRDAFAAAHGRRDAGTRVIPNGCDVPEDRRFPGLATERPARIVYAGQLYPWKGVDVLVDALAEVPGARLVILGGIEGEADAARVRDLVRARGLMDRTEMPGTVPPERVAQELKRAAAVVVPFLKTAMTEAHTSPLKAFEAMAAGRPIVASDLPSSREVLRHGENALLVPPGSAGELGAALRRILEDGELAWRLAQQAYADAPAYSWDTRGRRIKELIEAVRS